MLQNHFVLALLWILYCALHSVLASGSVKKFLQIKLGQKFRFYRLFYTVFAFITLVALFWFQVTMKQLQLFKSGTILLLVGVLISLGGLLLMLICIKKYFMSLSGLMSLVAEKNFNNSLIITGIHRHMRHPLYLGTFIFISGLLLLLPYLSLLISNVVITLYTIIAIKFEENKLIEEFGDQYKEYQKSVPKLIPRLTFTGK